jgi:hypothetical protein
MLQNAQSVKNDVVDLDIYRTVTEVAQSHKRVRILHTHTVRMLRGQTVFRF